jgi:hypothetical protein
MQMSENNVSGLTFNPEVFLNMAHQEANSTELLPVPDGDYVAVSEPVTDKNFVVFKYKNGDKAGQDGVMLKLTWAVNDEGGALKAMLGREPKVSQTFSLDIKADGGLEFGKGRNVELGRLREALGQNGNGQPWAFSMLGGKVAKIGVKTSINAKDQKSYTNVIKVAKV